MPFLFMPSSPSRRILAQLREHWKPQRVLYPSPSKARHPEQISGVSWSSLQLRLHLQSPLKPHTTTSRKTVERSLNSSSPSPKRQRPIPSFSPHSLNATKTSSPLPIPLSKYPLNPTPTLPTLRAVLGAPRPFKRSPPFRLLVHKLNLLPRQQLH